MNKRAFILILIFASLLFSTAAYCKNRVRYDDPTVPKELNRLRKFRDFHLKKSRAGMEFVKYYYRYGPIAAKAISKRDRLRSLVRLSLLPLMYAGANFDNVMMFLKIFAIFIALVFCGYIYTKIKRITPTNRRIMISI